MSENVVHMKCKIHECTKNCTLNEYGMGHENMTIHNFNSNNEDLSNFGTFKDSKSAPIHRWFQYPAGFSYKAVEYSLKKYGIKEGNVVYDPFAGTGTTNVVCKMNGIESYGVEAHPFVVKIAQTKVKWDYNYTDLNEQISNFLDLIYSELKRYKEVDINVLPELVRKCYCEDNLKRLLFLRYLIEDNVKNEYKDLYDVALVGSLRIASGAGTGWPYIAPNKKIGEKDGIETFIKQLNLCTKDLLYTPESHRNLKCEIIEGDSRKTNLPDDYFDFVFTSPPYLNNYDYADRTRLETYFMGLLTTWGDITEKVRTKLIMSATTQVVRSAHDIENITSDELKSVSPSIAHEIQERVSSLSIIRKSKGGKKSYDIMVGQYFNDLTSELVDTYRLMKEGSKFLLILGDSAPYGVHVPTEKYLGEIALGIGFKEYETVQLRKRGDKWKNNPQRHKVPLKESILILTK